LNGAFGRQAVAVERDAQPLQRPGLGPGRFISAPRGRPAACGP